MRKRGNFRMYDNGLLEHYRSLKSQDGYLDVSTLGVTENPLEYTDNVVHKLIDGKSYYTKFVVPSQTTAKYLCDAEILLSQIYNKAGISSAVYLPVYNEHSKFLISNDVEKPDVVLARNHLFEKLLGEGRICLPFLAKKETMRVNPASIYTTYAMQQQTKMRVLDTASYNFDRHYGNFFFKLHHAPDDLPVVTLQDVKNSRTGIIDTITGILQNKVQDVVAIDFDVSGLLLDPLGKNLIQIFDSYYDDFSMFEEPRDRVIEQIQTSEEFAQLMDKQALAEEIGSLSPACVAREIKETIGYQIEPKMVDTLSRSYDEMAETLIK